MQKIAPMALLAFFLGGAPVADSALRPVIEVTVEFRHFPFPLVPHDIVRETACSKRQLYLAPWVTEFQAEISAYNSEIGQTDDDPWIAANGREVFDGGIATNVLPCGSKVLIPDLFGEKVLTVNDRMNRRYHPVVQNGKINLDIWMAEKEAALRLGRKDGVRVVVIGYHGA